MTEIYLGFSSLRLHEVAGEMHYDMWPALGTQMMMPLRGPVSALKVLRNSDEELVLEKGMARYSFRFSPRQAGPDSLKFSVKLLGFLPLGSCWGDISADGKQMLRAAFGGLNE